LRRSDDRNGAVVRLGSEMPTEPGSIRVLTTPRGGWDPAEATAPAALDPGWVEELGSNWPVYRVVPGCDRSLVVTCHRSTGRGGPAYEVRKCASRTAARAEDMGDLVALVDDWRSARGRTRRLGRHDVDRVPFDSDALRMLDEWVGGLSSLCVEVDGTTVEVEAAGGGMHRAAATAPEGIGEPVAVADVIDVLSQWEPASGGFDPATYARVIPGHGVLLDRWFEDHDDVLAEVERVAMDRRVFERGIALTHWPRAARPNFRGDLFVDVAADWWHSRAVTQIATSRAVGAGSTRDAGESPAPPAPPAPLAAPLGVHSWSWRIAADALERLVTAPHRIGECSAVEVLERASEMLATGPAALPELVEVLLAARPGDAQVIRDHVRDAVAGGQPTRGTVIDLTDRPGGLVQALACALVHHVDFDRVGTDLEALSTELAVRNGEAPSGLADCLAQLLQTQEPTTSVLDDAAWALEAAGRLVDAGLVPLGARSRERTVAATAGWLVVALACRSAPSALASVLSVPSAARTAMRILAQGVGPFAARAHDGTSCSAPFRSGGTLLIGIPGSGKTELLAWLAATASGPVVASTPLPADIEKLSVRATDHDVLVFDPAGLLGSESPPGVKVVTIDLLDAVTDWESAGRVAANMVDAANLATSGGVNEPFWRQASKQAIRLRLIAATMCGDEQRSLADVLHWLSRSAESEVMALLARSDCEEAARAFVNEMGITDERTVSNIHAAARADMETYCNVAERGERLDLDRFVAGTGTLVLLADPLHAAATLPAVGLLTRFLIEARFRRFHRGFAGVPMLVLADEVVRMPAIGNSLGELLAVGSSRSVNIVAAAQATRQLDALPGGAEEMLTAAGRTLFFPGSMSENLLRLAPFLNHSDSAAVAVSSDGDTVGVERNVGFDAARVARPAPDTVNLLESGTLTPVVACAAHREPLWRLAALDAAFGRSGIAPTGAQSG
jgi:hypothetical protein